MSDKTKENKISRRIHELCGICKNFINDAALAYDCYSKKCPSMNKTLKIDGWGPDKTRKPTWDPNII